MSPEEIASLEPHLERFLEEFADCFARSEPRRHLGVYLRGQMSNLPRKSVEPIALAADVAPRTLQKFLTHADWAHDAVRQKLQRIVARDHADADAVWIVDETSFAKKGTKTPGVQRQHCGSRGKIENCIVTVHGAYFAPASGFRTLLDSDLFVPEKSWNDSARRAEAHIPEDVVYRPKWQIALEQIDRGRATGLPFAWVTADEYYGSKPGFLGGLERRGLPYVVEVPRNTFGWLIAPATIAGERPKRVDHLCRFSIGINRQPWTRIHVKDTHKGAVVWKCRAAAFSMRRHKQIVGGLLLIHATNELDPAEVKYFIARAPADTPIERIIGVAFSRFPIERCFEDAKSELGLGHFEGRSYHGLLRHCHVTALTHLFLASQTQRLAEKKSRGDDLSGSRRRRRRGDRPNAQPSPAASALRENLTDPGLLPAAQPNRPPQSR